MSVSAMEVTEGHQASSLLFYTPYSLEMGSLTEPGAMMAAEAPTILLSLPPPELSTPTLPWVPRIQTQVLLLAQQLRHLPGHHGASSILQRKLRRKESK